MSAAGTVHLLDLNRPCGWPATRIGSRCPALEIARSSGCKRVAVRRDRTGHVMTGNGTSRLALPARTVGAAGAPSPGHDDVAREQPRLAIAPDARCRIVSDLTGHGHHADRSGGADR